jgi:phenylalanyl-tRNA synthetase beta chain
LPGAHLFEIGSTFRPGQDRLEEHLQVGFVLSGCGLPVHWSLPRREVGFYDARGAAELLLDLLGISTPTFSSDRISYLAPGGSLGVTSGGQPLGVVGEIARPVLDRYGIDGSVFGGHFDLAALQRAPVVERRHRALPRYPAVRRDLALIVNRQVTFDMIERVVRASGSVPIAEVQVFDLYHGSGVPEGCVSVAIQVVFQHRERTLETEEVQAAQEAIVTELDAQLGARLRGGAPG